MVKIPYVDADFALRMWLANVDVPQFRVWQFAQVMGRLG